MGSEEIGDRSIGSGELGLGLGVVRGRWWLVRGAAVCQVRGVDSQVWGGDNGKQVYSQVYAIFAYFDFTYEIFCFALKRN